MNKEQALYNLINAKYRFAKTMKHIPHSYTIRDTWSDQKAFNDCVQFIRNYGIAEHFFRQEYIYYYHNEYKYWTMGNPVEQIKLINRAKA